MLDHYVPLWQHRKKVVLVALVFVVKGGHSLLLQPRAKWAYPIENGRPLLIIHWSLATPFLAGVLWQRLTVPKIAEAGQRHTQHVARKRRTIHRVIGRITMVSSLGAAITALCLAPRALAGWWVFTGWAVIWIGVTIMAWRAARQKRWDDHKRWAEALSRTGIAFVFGRVVLVAYSHALWHLYKLSVAEHSEHVKAAYYWAVVGTGAFTLTTTAQCARAHSRAERRSRAQMRWRKLRNASAFDFLMRQSRRGREAIEKESRDS